MMVRDFSTVLLACDDCENSPIKSLVESEIPILRLIVSKRYDDVVNALNSSPDIGMFIVDYSFGDAFSPETVGQLRNWFPQLRILVVSPLLDFDQISAFLMNGAQGCILRSERVEEVGKAIKTVAEGGVYFPSFLDSLSSSEDLNTSRKKRITSRLDSPTIIDLTPEAIPSRKRLSKRQRHVLNLVAQGLSNKAIARELDLAEGTVKVRAFKTLNVNNRVQAVAKMMSERMFG